MGGWGRGCTLTPFHYSYHQLQCTLQLSELVGRYSPNSISINIPVPVCILWHIIRANWDPSPPLPKASVSLLPPNQRVGNTLDCGWGGGRTQFGQLEKRHSTLSTLWLRPLVFPRTRYDPGFFGDCGFCLKKLIRIQSQADKKFYFYY